MTVMIGKHPEMIRVFFKDKNPSNCVLSMVKVPDSIGIYEGQFCIFVPNKDPKLPGRWRKGPMYRMFLEDILKRPYIFNRKTFRRSDRSHRITSIACDKWTIEYQ